MDETPITDKDRKAYDHWRRLPQNRDVTFEEFLAKRQKKQEAAPEAPAGETPKPKPLVKFAEISNGTVRCPHCGSLSFFEYVDFYDTLPSHLKKEFNQSVELKMSLIKTEADSQVIRPVIETVVQLEMRHKYERMNPRDTKELSAAHRGYLEDLEIITPRSRRLAGRKTDETLSTALARRVKSGQEARARAPRLEEEIATLMKPLPNENEPAPEQEGPEAPRPTPESDVP